ncbi:unnamed protein product [Pleuronectes platessa]|uniref:Uncharacterized protein n=1 Tax=Pleuronectes platessa TaxID=8262 RepID=A0A9N7UMQ8_PLEPL|nr:unnamed protein product [Pleuronectes platessa]
MALKKVGEDIGLPDIFFEEAEESQGLASEAEEGVREKEQVSDREQTHICRIVLCLETVDGRSHLNPERCNCGL